MNKNENSVDKTVIIINNSPIEIGHVLLVPEINSCLNQVRVSITKLYEAFKFHFKILTRYSTKVQLKKQFKYLY